MNQTARRWAEQSQYDLDTARAMLASGRYLYVLFCCQQAAEKALKAVIVQRTGEMPPRLHNLLRLAETAGIELSIDQNRFLGELSAYYIQSRYPDEINSLGSTITREIGSETLSKTEETVKWLCSMIE